MNYNIESVIKRLQEAQKNGKDIIDEAELIKIATPRINNINEQIKLIDRGIDKLRDKEQNRIEENDFFIQRTILRNPHLRGSYFTSLVSFTNAENLTGIPRRTFYRWRDEHILQCYGVSVAKTVFSLQELKETLIRTEQTKG